MCHCFTLKLRTQTFPHIDYLEFERRRFYMEWYVIDKLILFLNLGRSINYSLHLINIQAMGLGRELVGLVKELANYHQCKPIVIQLTRRDLKCQRWIHLNLKIVSMHMTLNNSIMMNHHQQHRTHSHSTLN